MSLDDKTVTLQLPTATRWEAELHCDVSGLPAFIDVRPDGPAAAAGITDGDIFVQIGFIQITPRSLESACHAIWEAKRNAQALGKKSVD